MKRFAANGLLPRVIAGSLARKFALTLIFALIMTMSAGAAFAATHLVEKVTASTVSFPTGFAAGDTLVIYGDELDGTDWEEIKAYSAADYHLVIYSGGTLPRMAIGDEIAANANHNILSLTAFKLTGSMGFKAFKNCDNLVSVSMPQVTDGSTSTFEGCTNLAEVNLPLITSAPSLMFKDCADLQSINLPALTLLSTFAFDGALNLNSISLPAVETIEARALLNAATASTLTILLPGTKPTIDADLPLGTRAAVNIISTTDYTLADFPGTAAVNMMQINHSGNNNAFGPYVVDKDAESVKFVNPSFSFAENFDGKSWEKWDGSTWTPVAGITTNEYSVDASAVARMGFTHTGGFSGTLPANRAVVGTPTSFSGSDESGGHAPGDRIDVEFAIEGDAPITGVFTSPFTSGIVVAFDDPANATKATITGTVPEQAGEHVITFAAVNDTDFWWGDTVAQRTYTVKIEQATVTFESNGGSDVAAQAVWVGQKITKPDDPRKADSTFGGWFINSSFTAEWDFDADKVEGDTILYAKWNDGSDPTGISVTIEPASARLQVGHTLQLAADVRPTGTSQTVTWQSNDSSILTVDADGLATAIAIGNVTVEAISTVDTTKKGYCTINVTAEKTINDELNEHKGTNVSFGSPVLTQPVIDSLEQATGIANLTPVETAPEGSISTKAAPTTLDEGDRALTSSISIRIPVTSGNMLPIEFTIYHPALADVAAGWESMDNEERAAFLQEDADGIATAFCYEYADSTAAAPVRLIGDGGIVSWADAIADNVVRITNDGDIVVSYVAINGTGDAFVHDNMLVIYDNDDDDAYINDPAWLIRGTESQEEKFYGKNSSCSTISGGLALLFLIPLLSRVKRD